ncbi:UdgX family uracil-DNA binding protein [Microbacterium horticulturae]|uniref:Type-4 uracil-DNA glycosylase n=1 Tax=Microbacterium horticulturae TaxID=3028316 RepID=A0ABY8BU12_9MICO|nr:UdgX family uracil-DNA binding protein [Microbacterium sp. KACC 23027]WEG07674.1 UdgX family uracil-DNA binding protein [Microbacterium sp. KACC 23027]
MDDPDRPGAGAWLPATDDIEGLCEAAQSCRGCELWREATQTVFGDGSAPAELMLVGEQPGDREDLAGEPFVGPAGHVLHDALEAAGIRPDSVYTTNAVKHFRFEQRGKRRIHQSPQVAHIRACHPWLEAEVGAVDPRTIVCLGATAARAVLGRTVRIGQERGRMQEAEGRRVMVTAHPSAILRVRDERERASAFDALVADLRAAVA